MDSTWFLAASNEMHMEPANSYYRLLVHRVARYYGLNHMADQVYRTILLISKGPHTEL